MTLGKKVCTVITGVWGWMLIGESLRQPINITDIMFLLLGIFYFGLAVFIGICEVYKSEL
jgi:predicted cation transporter